MFENVQAEVESSESFDNCSGQINTLFICDSDLFVEIPIDNCHQFAHELSLEVSNAL